MTTYSLVSDLKSLRVGVDFVDAVTGSPRCVGEFERSRPGVASFGRMPFSSTLDIATTERIIRRSAAEYGSEVIYFRSQACEGT